MKVVLSGSGILYPMQAGSLQCLVEHGVDIESICGVSGGAIIAAAVASGYSPGQELNELVLATLPGPNDLLDYSWTPFWDWGLIRGDLIENEFVEYLATDFQSTEIPLRILAVNIHKRQQVCFGGREGVTPVPRAVRASISIPGVFSPVEIDGELHVDGGIVSNLPLNIFKGSDDVMGICFSDRVIHREGISGVKDYFSAIVTSMIKSNMLRHLRTTKHSGIVYLDPVLPEMNLKMTESEGKHLIECGYKQTLEWLEGTPDERRPSTVKRPLRKGEASSS